MKTLLAISASRFILVALLLAVTPGVSAQTNAPQPAREATKSPRPNILFVFSDDHSCQTIGAYRGRLSEYVRQQNITPNIDRLAEQGAIFDRSFCGTSLCSPSRATVLTGVHAHKHAVLGLSGSVPADLWSFPPALHDSGYQTALIGKWHLGSLPVGFDYYRVFPTLGVYWNATYFGPDNLKEKSSGYSTDDITARSLAWLKARDKSKPFLLMVHHKAPHQPCEPPPRYYKLLADAPVPEPASLFENLSDRPEAVQAFRSKIQNLRQDGDLKVFPPGEMPKSIPPTERNAWTDAFGARNKAFLNDKPDGRALTQWKYQEYTKDYLRCVKAVDDSVGQLVEYLKQEGLESNTVVIYSSDQGYFSGEHGWYDKRMIYEESISMPLIVRWPGAVKPGTRVSQLVQNIDYAPTFADLAGVKVPADVQGRSLVPLLRGEPVADWRRAVFYRAPEAPNPKHYGLRTERYTLAHYYETDEWELFDLEKDPQQLRSVYADPAYAATRDELKAELQRLRAAYQDTDENWKAAVGRFKESLKNPAMDERSSRQGNPAKRRAQPEKE